MDIEAEWVSKADIASRQLSGAIRLFFGEGDPIVIHTIVGSAHQILIDLGKKKEIHTTLRNTSSLKKQEVQEYLSKINYPYNFLKHADRDPDKKINVTPLLRLTADFIMDAVWMLQQLNGKLPLEVKLYWTWFVSKYKEEFPDDGEIGRMKRLNLGNLDFKGIFALLKFGELAESIPAAKDAADGIM